MKRRNVEPGKLRRPMKAKKTSEGVYSSLLGYVKFLVIWGLVLLADFISGFRFEYLYPFWLLYKTMQDSYKYQGLLLTMLFLMAALGADVIFYIFVPVQWLFFAASSYVWVQYVWHTDRGICLSSVSLWLLFVYVEAALRMKDHKALPFNMDLCRPFAAHCIGYPVVTLGYGIKTAASESIRRRTRSKVKKSNRFYHHLIQEALPLELQESKLTDDLTEDVTASSEQIKSKKDSKHDGGSDSESESSEVSSSIKSDSNTTNTTTAADKLSSHHSKSDQHKSSFIEDYDINAEIEARELHRRNVNDLSEEAENMINDSKSNKVGNKELPTAVPSTKKVNNRRSKSTTSTSSSYIAQSGAAAAGGVTQIPPSLTNGHAVGDSAAAKPEFVISRLESDVKRLKADLQASRNTESELRSQLSSKSNDDKLKKVNLAQLQQDNDNLQNKLHNLVMSRQQDKQNLASVEKKLQEEKKLREKSEGQLVSERKIKKQEDQVAARAVALATANRSNECVGECKSKVKELEESIFKLSSDITKKDGQIVHLENVTSEMRRQIEGDPNTSVNRETLMSALRAMEVRNRYLENNMREETKIKIQLYAAVNDIKRQLDLQAQIITAKDMEISGLRSHITEALALVPSSMYNDEHVVSGQYTTPKLGSPMMGSSSPVFSHQNDTMNGGGSIFNPQQITPPAVSQQNSQHNAASPRYSPTLSGEVVSPSRTPHNEPANPPLNPQAKDYMPASPSAQ